MKPPTKLASSPSITPEQLREARALLYWSPHLLAQMSRVTTSFIYGFEKTGRVASLRWRPQGFDALASIRAALEAAGVEFTSGDLPGVKLRKAKCAR